jgi:hypothetical protein
MAETLFLDGAETMGRVKGMMGNGKEARLAVAYWGKGACRELGIDAHNAPVRVLCDLFSGGCNPAEIKLLLNAGVRIKTKAKIHSKVYCFPDCVVIGSSNASAGGLGFEGKEAKSNIEANLLSRDADVIRRVAVWFEAEWSGALDVDATLADEAIPFWEHAQEHRVPPVHGTLLAEIKKHPKKYRAADLWVALYPNGAPSAQARKAYAPVAPIFYSGQQLRELDGYYPFYEDDDGSFPVKPGATTILDFSYDSEAKPPSFEGIWRIREKDFSIPMKVKGYKSARIIMCDLLHEYQGLRLPKMEYREIAQVLHSYAKANNVWNDWKKDGNHRFTVWKKLADLINAAKSCIICTFKLLLDASLWKNRLRGQDYVPHSPLCQRSCRPDRIANPGARKAGSGSIRTGLQRSDCGAVTAAGEFGDRRGIA